MRGLLLLLAACTGNPNYPPDLPLDEAYTACESVDDCVVVELGCCDHCNGGMAVAVNKDSLAEVEETYSESCPANQGCTLMGCGQMVAECNDQVCEAVQEPLTPTGSTR